MKPFIYIVLAVFMFSSCKPILKKDKSSYEKVRIDTIIKDNIIRDTIYKEINRIITLPSHTDLEIKNICDSLDFQIKTGTGINESIISIKNGALIISQKIDSIKQTQSIEKISKLKNQVTILKKQIKESKSSEKVEERRKPFKFILLWIALIISIILNAYQFFKL